MSGPGAIQAPHGGFWITAFKPLSRRSVVGLDVGCDGAYDFRSGERLFKIINRSQLHRFQVACNIMVTADDDDRAVTVSRYRMLQDCATLESGAALAGHDAVEIGRFKKACCLLKIRTRLDLKSTVVQDAAIVV